MREKKIKGEFSGVFNRMVFKQIHLTDYLIQVLKEVGVIDLVFSHTLIYQHYHYRIKNKKLFSTYVAGI